MKPSVWSLAALGVAGVAAAAFAQDRRGPDMPFRDGPRGRPEMSQQDRDAFLDARIAALHAGLKLTADQEKMWPPVEDALRGLVKQRQAAREAGREHWASLRDSNAPRSIPDELRFMADRQAASADALRKLADASGPLYGSLDDGQKRRLMVLGRFIGRPGGHHGPMHGRDMRRGDLGGPDGFGPGGPGGRFAGLQGGPEGRRGPPPPPDGAEPQDD